MSLNDPRSGPPSPLGLCPTCGALCLLGVYDHTGTWRAYAEPRTPVLGEPHQCQLPTEGATP